MMGEALRARRQERGLSQSDMAHRLGRSRARITELEIDLLHGRVGRDRLGLLAEACDALDLIPILVPRERAQAVQRLGVHSPGQRIALVTKRAFDDLFVDLADDAEEGA
jgi:transcriptional regulator with XRE-family HTH domain